MAESEKETLKRQRRVPRPVSPEAYADAHALTQQVLQGSLSQSEAEKILTARYYDLGDRIAFGYIGNYVGITIDPLVAMDDKLRCLNTPYARL
jgi:5-methylcytosine-specific restriction enzyme A